MRGATHRTTTTNTIRTQRCNQTEESFGARVHVVADAPELQERIVRGAGAIKNWEILLEEPRLGGAENAREKSIVGKPKEVVLMASSGGLKETLARVQSWKTANRGINVILLAGPTSDTDFLLYVRAGVRGMLPLDLSGTEIANAVRIVLDGGAVCESGHCAVLFRYFAQEAESFPSATLHRDLGLTRREQQLIPLLTRGLTNKEIANHFSLAEQTVKNHLYRMKRKIGANGRLEIVDVCRQHGFLA